GSPKSHVQEVGVGVEVSVKFTGVEVVGEVGVKVKLETWAAAKAALAARTAARRVVRTEWGRSMADLLTRNTKCVDTRPRRCDAVGARTGPPRAPSGDA